MTVVPPNTVSHKRLKSVAHNLGQSYLSLMNYRASDYVIAHLFRAARAANEPRFEVDVMAGRISPPALQTPVLKESVEDMRDYLPRALEAEGCSLDIVRSIRMTVAFRFEETTFSERVPTLEHEAYDCVVEILDDRGVLHKALVPEWWKY
jgi:hypothetical protein